jgi:hypothetical protein
MRSPDFHPFRVITFLIFPHRVQTSGPFPQWRFEVAMIDRSIQDASLLIHPAVYRIRVHGRLSTDWSERLRGMTLSTVAEGKKTFTEINGRLPDQAALMGVLDDLYSHAIPVIRVECISVDPQKKA